MENYYEIIYKEIIEFQNTIQYCNISVDIGNMIRLSLS